MARPLVFALPGNDALAATLADAMGFERGALVVRDFPDGESFVRIDTSPAGREAIVVATLRTPNAQLLPLIFLADTLRELGATRVGLVAPYLAYMRQDARFHEGEAVTSRSFAALISRNVDWLLTIDPHLHRIRDLRELYTIPATALHVAPLLGAWIAANVRTALIIGPDEESRQWVESVAEAAHAPWLVISKTRVGDTQVVESALALGAHRSCTPVVVDDIISTGRTMLAAVEQLRAQHSIAPVCVTVHAVFAGDAYATLRAAGASRIVTTNTIPHESNRIDVAPAIARALQGELGATVR